MTRLRAAFSLRVLHRPNKLLRPISTHSRYKNYLGRRHMPLVTVLWSTRQTTFLSLQLFLCKLYPAILQTQRKFLSCLF